MDDFEWQNEFLGHNDVKSGKQDFLSTVQELKNKSGDMQQDDEWFLFIRMGSIWMGGSTRMVYVVIARPADRHMHCCFVDGPTLAEAKKFSKPTVNQVLASLTIVIKSVHKRPIKLLCCPSGVSFRACQVLPLASQLKDVLKDIAPELTIHVPKCTPAAENYPKSLGEPNLLGDEELLAPWRTWDKHIDPRIRDMEAKLNAAHPSLSLQFGGYYASPLLSSKSSVQTDNLNASVDSLRELFASAKLFHETKVWEVLSNNQYLLCTDINSGLKGYAQVCGHTDYEGRGLIIYQTYQDLQQNLMNLRNLIDKLDFLAPNMVSMGTVDAVAAYNLPLAENDPNGEVYPSWNRHRGHSSTTNSVVMQNWNCPPSHDRWAFLAKVTRGVTMFATNPVYVLKDRYINGPCNMIASPVLLENLGLEIRAGHVDAGGVVMSDEDTMALMNIGAKDKCNFCNKPANVQELPVACQKCQIRYCSAKCEDTDKGRHERCCSGFSGDENTPTAVTRCNVCGVASKRSCALCKGVYYCSKDHQKMDWKVHKKCCRK